MNVADKSTLLVTALLMIAEVELSIAQKKECK